MRSYTVKLLLSLLLLLGANNAKAYCYATQWAEYGPVYSSLGVANGTTMESCQQLACQLFPFIPECGQPVQPTCTTRTETQSLSCQPNYSGAINQMRSNNCPDENMGDWVTVSDNCSPNPPTCNYSVQEEQVACGQNEIGSIYYKREQNCPDPYGSPVDSGWFEINRTCQAAPPTCQTTVQQRQLACQPNQSGAITQTMSTVCSDPYGQPTDTAWVTTSDSCVQDPPTCVASSQQKTEGCGVNEVGSKLYQADDTCPDPYGSTVNSGWYLVTNSCSPAPATCHESTTTRQGSCGENQLGSITYTETLTCPNPYANAVSSGWIATSNTCTPAPATCSTSTIQRELSCQDGYTGLITQSSTSSCPNPYGQPIFGAWVETQNSCQKSVTNPMNVNSPVSPISPVNQMDVPVQTPMEVPPVAPVEMQMTVETPKAETQKSSGSESTSSSPTAASSTETKETPQKIEVPKGRDLVPGFGLVMSLELLNKPMEFQQQQLQINLDYTQELSNEFRGNTDFLLQLLTDNDVGDSFRSRNDWLWGNLRRHNDIQPCYSCD
jgi:hypothetical protein